MTTLPTYEQVLDLPAQLTRRVPPEFIDENGHMNIGRYLELGSTALWRRCQTEMGMPDDYIATRGLSTFTAEHHLRYLSEMLLDEEVAVHTRMLARSDQVLHGMALITNRSRRRLACVLEATFVHVDMTTRRPTPFPDDVADLIDLALKSDSAPWPAPVIGSMGVRSRS